MTFINYVTITMLNYIGIASRYFATVIFGMDLALERFWLDFKVILLKLFGKTGA